MFYKYLFLLIVNLWPNFIFGESAKHSEVRTTAKMSKDLIYLTFEIVPGKNLVINEVGPWPLTISNLKGVRSEKTKFTKKDQEFQSSAQKSSFNFSVQTSSSNEPQSLTYHLAAFVCTNDKKTCFRDVHQGSLNLESNSNKL